MCVCGLKVNLSVHDFMCWADGMEINCCVEEVDFFLIYCVCDCDGWVMVVKDVNEVLKML